MRPPRPRWGRPRDPLDEPCGSLGFTRRELDEMMTRLVNAANSGGRRRAPDDGEE